MEMRILVQDRKDLDASKIVDFVSECNDARLIIFHSSLRSKEVFCDFFGSLGRYLQLPFVATRVSGTLTPGEGFREDSVVASVLCGDFEARVFHVGLDLNDSPKTSRLAVDKLDGSDLALVYSANSFRDNVKLDDVLRKIQLEVPGLQLVGGVSSPAPLVASNCGVHSDSLVFAAVHGADFGFSVESGFRFDEQEKEDYVVTKSGPYCIREINGCSAIDEYSRIQRMQPYLINTLASLFPRADMARAMKAMSKLNKVIYEGVLGVCIHALGADSGCGTPEMLFVMELDQKKDEMVVQSYKPEGTALKRLKTSQEDQLDVYDRIHKRFPESGALMINSCQCSLFWMDFDFKKLSERLNKIKSPYVISYVYGALGTQTPYEDQTKNLVHAGVVKTIAFK